MSDSPEYNDAVAEPVAWGPTNADASQRQADRALAPARTRCAALGELPCGVTVEVNMGTEGVSTVVSCAECQSLTAFADAHERVAEAAREHAKNAQTAMAYVAHIRGNEHVADGRYIATDGLNKLLGVDPASGQLNRALGLLIRCIPRPLPRSYAGMPVEAAAAGSFAPFVGLIVSNPDNRPGYERNLYLLRLDSPDLLRALLTNEDLLAEVPNLGPKNRLLLGDIYARLLEFGLLQTPGPEQTN